MPAFAEGRVRLRSLKPTSVLLALSAASAALAVAMLAATCTAACSAAVDASARTRFSSSSALRLAASATCDRHCQIEARVHEGMIFVISWQVSDNLIACYKQGSGLYSQGRQGRDKWLIAIAVAGIIDK